MIPRRRSLRWLTVLGALIASVTLGSQRSSPPSEGAYRANNLGVALLEQYNYDDAVKSFRRALDVSPELHIARMNLSLALLYSGAAEDSLTTARQAQQELPTLCQPHYAAGLALRSLGKQEESIAEFRKVLELDPDDIGSRVNIAQVQVQQRDFAAATALFREALDREPYNVTAVYGLATALTRSGSPDAPAAMKRFEALRDQPYGVTYANTYLEQGRYGEAIAPTGAEPELVDPSPPTATFTDASAEWVRDTAAGSQGASAGQWRGVTMFDADGDGDLDALLVGEKGSRFYVNASGVLTDATEAAGLRAISAAAHAAVAGDYDNDGRPDLLLLENAGLRLLHRTAAGRFEDATAVAGFKELKGARSAAFVDVDHDGDLDIVVAGAGTRLLRNNGNGTFTDIITAARIGEGPADGIAIAPTDFDDRRDIDLVILGGSGAPRLLQNVRDGSFRDVAGTVGFPTTGRFTALAAGDFNKDGYPDFLFARADSAAVFSLSDGRGRFARTDAPASTAGATVAQFVDYDNDGLLDLFTASASGARMFRNVGKGWSDVTEVAGVNALAKGFSGEPQSIAFGDIDGDGDIDALVMSSSRLHVWRNDGGKNRSLVVRLAGKVSNRGGVGSKVDLRAGSLRQRIETSAVTPPLRPADLVFGLGTRSAADVVRLIWPSGTLQAEVTGDARALTLTELDRKPSSCPYLYTWNGSRFEFVTDFMGGGEMGHWESPGVWSTPDPDEYVRIPPGRLVAKEGRYEIRVTNELEETLFADRMQLIAVDHPEGVEIFPNEGLGSPSGGKFLITTTRGAHPPRAVSDEHGHDMLARVVAIDRQYSDDFALSDIRGYAAEHDLLIDVGAPSTGVVLLATGWTDYAFSADNIAAYQRGLQLTLPRLDVKTSLGTWRTAIENIGIPVGRPQTVVVDLRGKLQPVEHELRIRTNMRIYWDQILVDTSDDDRMDFSAWRAFLNARGAPPPLARPRRLRASGEPQALLIDRPVSFQRQPSTAVIAGPGEPELRITRLDATSALLHWRGFSKTVTPDGREPLGFDYERVSQSMPWKTMIGRYTREGDVRVLLNKVDDMFVIARPGDEIALSFDASALPALGSGRARTFLFYADGFSKEMDITSASPHTVLPLPFHAMRGYPYAQDQQYPSGAAYREYQARYNTRIVSRTVPPVESVDRR
jgi:tetratricopeptide (TPR) repeat protein